MMSALQRIRQGVRALFAFSQPVDLTLAADYLSPELLALFERMSRSEQLHSLNILREILAQGPVEHDLAVAALLHDVGKTRYPLAVWQKTLAVLVCAAAPDWFRRWSHGNPAQWWYRAFAVATQHPAWGAQLAADAGASPTTVWLIEHHAGAPADWSGHPSLHLLQRLQQADDAN